MRANCFGAPAIAVLLAVAAVPAAYGSRLTVKSNCAFPVWLQAYPNAQVAPLPASDALVSLPASGASHAYAIPASGWAGRFWPRLGCKNANGTDCDSGESVPPCPQGGCQPPADTKVEFNFGAAGEAAAGGADAATTWFDVSLVDGYSLGVGIVPTPAGPAGSGCIATQCDLSLSACPGNETLGLGDLRVVAPDGRTVQCLSPCKRWNWPAPLGLGRPEQAKPGALLCCPTPPVSPAECRAGPVEATRFVQLVHKSCPTAYR